MLFFISILYFQSETERDRRHPNISGWGSGTGTQNCRRVCIVEMPLILFFLWNFIISGIFCVHMSTVLMIFSPFYGVFAQIYALLQEFFETLSGFLNDAEEYLQFFSLFLKCFLPKIYALLHAFFETLSGFLNHTE